MYIDLSKYNRVTDWKAVSEHVEGVILRAGYRGYQSGKIVIDPTFETYVKSCYNYNIPFGFYFMSQAITPIEAIEEAEFVLNYAEKYNPKLPIFIDSEDGDGKPTIVRADALNVEDRTTVCEMFCQTVVNARFKAGTYASTSWFEHRLDISRLDRYLLWVAQYSDAVRAKHRVDIWQYTSKGTIPGIQGNVDCNIIYGLPNSATFTSRTLRRGDKGWDVKELQVRLNQRGYNIKADGDFGPITQAAVRALQKSKGITVDGIVGNNTKKFL